MNRTHKITTTTETSRWEDGEWVPVERTIRVETHQSNGADE